MLLLTLLSLVLKVHGGFDYPLWGDEFFQRDMTYRATWTELVSWTHDHPYYDWPAGYFILTRIAQAIPGSDNVWGWRWPGIAAAVLCVPLCYQVARRLGISALGAITVAGLCACDLNLNFNAQIARAYPFKIFFVLLALSFGLGRTGLRWWLPTALAFLAALWMHVFSFVFLGPAAVALLLVGVWQYRRSAGPFASDALAVGLWVALVGGAIHFCAQALLRHFLPHDFVPGATSWSQTFAYVRWLVGRLTWVPLPLANPLLFVAALFGLGWFGFRRGAPIAIGFLVGALVVCGMQFYVLQHHFSEPRYLLTVSMALWFGWAMLAEMLPPRFRRLTLVVLLALLPLQAHRAWHNERYYGMIAHDERGRARTFVLALRAASERAGAAPIRLMPHRANIPEAAHYAGIKTIPGTAEHAANFEPDENHLVWLIGHYEQRNTWPFVMAKAERWFPALPERQAFLAAAKRAHWSLVIEGRTTIETYHY